MQTKTPVPLKAPLARYANYFEVGHNRYEFLVDFGQFHPETDKVALHTRIALGPPHAKMLSRLLSDAIRAYEAKSGEIASVGESGDGLAAVLRTLPNIERRAVAARQRAQSASTDSIPDPARRSPSKR
jgi:hypothetical protein